MAITNEMYDRVMAPLKGGIYAQNQNKKSNAFGDVHDSNQAVDLEYLIAKIEDYRQQGLMEDVEKAANQARGETREWIENHHPKYAFTSKKYPQGINLIEDNYNNKTHHQTVFGSFQVISNVINANLYANYFQRFANTGVNGGDPHTRWWGYNQNAIQEYFVKTLDKKLDNLLNNRS